jgi:ssDNA-binding Zn-finger/Zn-ribbon topoisomerase 1
MMGRYGMDQLYFGLFGFYIVIILINSFVRWPLLAYGDNLILLYMMFRFFSRNIYKRRRENEAFLRLIKPFRGGFSYRSRQLREIRTHAYHKCPKCKATLRFPRKEGKFPVTCPQCGHKFNIRNWF